MRALWLLLLLCACRDTRLTSGGCREDKDCGSPTSAFRCEAQTGLCYCRTDLACPGAQFCNNQGFCQDRQGCQTNLDCDTNTYCETASGQCVPQGRCTSDLQCNLGQVCDTARGSCVEGCHGDGDCPGSSCRCGDLSCACDGGDCALGVCDPYFCSNDTFCKFGELCAPQPDAGSPRNTCYSDYDFDYRPYCARCTSGGGVDTCGRGPNFCITDTRTRSTYCGADCSAGQACPRGYQCRDIRVVLTRWSCDVNTACQGDPTLPCTDDSQCARGGTCSKLPGASSGYCAGQCRLREGSNFGFCSCQQDSDCVTDTCTAGECSVTRLPCVDDTQCRTIRCVEDNGVGACLIGQNCTPANGLTCVEVGGG